MKDNEKVWEEGKETPEGNAKVQHAVDEIKKNLQKLGKGKLKLEVPIRAGGQNVEELNYDFTQLTGVEYADALDKYPEGSNGFQITQKQALSLFAVAAGKATDKVDAVDVMRGITCKDAVTATRVTRLFFEYSSRMGDMRITND